AATVLLRSSPWLPWTYDARRDAPLAFTSRPAPAPGVLDHRCRLRRGHLVAGTARARRQRPQLVLHVRVADLRRHCHCRMVAPDPRGPQGAGGPPVGTGSRPRGAPGRMVGGGWPHGSMVRLHTTWRGGRPPLA